MKSVFEPGPSDARLPALSHHKRGISKSPGPPSRGPFYRDPPQLAPRRPPQAGCALSCLPSGAANLFTSVPRIAPERQQALENKC